VLTLEQKMIPIHGNLYVHAGPFGFKSRFPNGLRGYIERLSHLGAWKKKFFVLQKNELRYYTDETCTKLLGCYVLDRSSNLSLSVDDTNFKDIIILKTKKLSEDETIQTAQLRFDSISEKTSWFRAFNETVNSGFRLVVQPDLLSNFYPSVDLVINYHDSDDKIIVVDDGNTIEPHQLVNKPQVSFLSESITHRYFSFLMIDLDYPARADTNRRLYLHWGLINIRDSDFTTGNEVFLYVVAYVIYCIYYYICIVFCENLLNKQIQIMLVII
jgi:hypothetical protein